MNMCEKHKLILVYSNEFLKGMCNFYLLHSKVLQVQGHAPDSPICEQPGSACHRRSPLMGGGDEFQLAFAKIGDICSLLPEKVGVHALTATATTVTKRLYQWKVLALPPFRENIR